jgi:hypothetical protein
LHDHLCANEPVILKVMHPRVDKKTGKTISTTLIDPFTQPAINERVLVEVDDTSSMRDGSKPKTTKSFLHIAWRLLSSRKDKGAKYSRG